MQDSNIRHVVVFSLIHAPGSQKAEAFLNDAFTQLTSIAVVNKFEVLRQVSQKNNFQYGFSMEFSDADAYEQYNNHSVHVKFVKERWDTEVSDFLEIDLTMLKN